MAQKLIFIAGSPSKTSRSFRLLEAVALQLQAHGVEPRFYSQADFDASALLQADTTNPQVKRFIEDVQTSGGLVVATPVYKGTFAGTLKVILDVIPPDALISKVALGIATARLESHLQGANAGISGIFDFFQISRQVPSVLLTDEALNDPHDATRLSERALRAVKDAADRFHSFLS